MGPFLKIVILFLLIIGLHFLANTFGIYDQQIKAGFVWFDNILHILVGIAFGLLWLLMVKKKKVASSSILASIQIMTFVFVMALTWELFEFVFFKLFTSYANNLKIYSPSIKEATVDMLSNIVGSVLIIFWKKDKLV